MVLLLVQLVVVVGMLRRHDETGIVLRGVLELLEVFLLLVTALLSLHIRLIVIIGSHHLFTALKWYLGPVLLMQRLATILLFALMERRLPLTLLPEVPNSARGVVVKRRLVISHVHGMLLGKLMGCRHLLVNATLFRGDGALAHSGGGRCVVVHKEGLLHRDQTLLPALGRHNLTIFVMDPDLCGGLLPRGRLRHRGGLFLIGALLGLRLVQDNGGHIVLFLA